MNSMAEWAHRDGYGNVWCNKHEISVWGVCPLCMAERAQKKGKNMETLQKYIMGVNRKGEIIPKAWSGGVWYKVSDVEEAQNSTDFQQLKAEIAAMRKMTAKVDDSKYKIGYNVAIDEVMQKLSAIDKKVCILKSDGERKDSASYAGICPVCQSHIQLSMYSGEGKVSGASPDTANSKTQTVKIDFKYLKKAILKFDAKSVYQQAAIIMLRQVFKDYKEK